MPACAQRSSPPKAAASVSLSYSYVNVSSHTTHCSVTVCRVSECVTGA